MPDKKKDKKGKKSGKKGAKKGKKKSIPIAEKPPTPEPEVEYYDSEDSEYEAEVTLYRDG